MRPKKRPPGNSGSFFSQSGWSIALRGKGEWTNDEVRSELSESYFTLEKHKTHRKAVSVQKSEEYKTLTLMLLGEITFVIRPDCIFVNLWGACDSSVLQCRTLQDDSLLERRIPCWWVWRQPSASMMDVLDDWISVMTLIEGWKWHAFHLYSKTGETRLKISYLREIWMSPKETIDRTAVTKQTWTGQPLQGKNSKIAITEQPWQIAIIGLRQQDC